MSGYHIIKADQLPDCCARTGVLIDVRTGMEHGEKHLAQEHEHIPLDVIDPAAALNRLGKTMDVPIYLVCRSGKRAATAAEKFVAAGCQNVYVVDGGVQACADCGHATEGHYKSAGHCKPVSLERQVRIAAGSFVALGAVLALTVHPAFALIPLCVGGGLIFAGITDRCGLALVLAHAPWNKAASI